MRYWVVFHYGNEYKGTGPTVFFSVDHALKFIKDYVDSPIRISDDLMAKGVSIEDRNEETTFYIPIFPKSVWYAYPK